MKKQKNTVSTTSQVDLWVVYVTLDENACGHDPGWTFRGLQEVYIQHCGCTSITVHLDRLNFNYPFCSDTASGIIQDEFLHLGLTTGKKTTSKHQILSDLILRRRRGEEVLLSIKELRYRLWNRCFALIGDLVDQRMGHVHTILLKDVLREIKR